MKSSLSVDPRNKLRFFPYFIKPRQRAEVTNIIEKKLATVIRYVQPF